MKNIYICCKIYGIILHKDGGAIMEQLETKRIDYQRIMKRRRKRTYIVSLLLIISIVGIVIYGNSKNKVDYLYNMGKGRYGLEDLRDLRKDYEKELNIQNIDYSWGDGVELGNKPKYIIYHHSASSNLSAEQIHEMHLQRGWSGIGYHFYIRKDGTIYRGRKEEMIGICLEGNFEDESITYKQMNSLVKLSADMIIKYNIEESEGHKDVYNTLCPGKNFDIKEIQEKVANELIRLEKE